MTPAEVFHALIEGVCAKRADTLPDLYAEDAYVTHPMSDSPPLVGREALRAHFARLPGMPIEMTPENVVVHETADPEVVIGEFEYHLRVTRTGRTFIAPAIFVLRVRDGLIVSSRDYGDGRARDAALNDAALNDAPVNDEER